MWAWARACCLPCWRAVVCSAWWPPTGPRALACARENLQRLGLTGRVELQQQDLFPEGKAPLVVCNPPWLPARVQLAH